MRDRHFFAGVNSPTGFYSCFDNLAPDKKCKRKIYIKGGPGMGKSTLMKKIASRAHEEGFSTDIFHCSSDSGSYDGVYIPKLKAAVVDATAPHNSDPEYPGITGEIFNAAQFLFSEKLSESAEEIIHFTQYKKQAFTKAYNYLSAAASVITDIEQMYESKMYLHGADIEAQRATAKYLPEITMPKSGNVRKLFVSAICPDGFVNFLDTAFGKWHTVTVKGGCATSRFLKKLLDTALMRGFSVEAFYCPLFPGEKLEHLIIRDINIVFTTYNHYHHFSGNETVELDEYIREIPSGVDEAWSIAGLLLKQAINSLSEARAAHSFLESFYTPAMDFDALTAASKELIESIF